MRDLVVALVVINFIFIMATDDFWVSEARFSTIFFKFRGEG